VIVQVPLLGNPLTTTLPVGTLHVGCVITPIIGILGFGLTVIVKVLGVPVQPLAVGVTVMVPVIGAVVVLVAVKLAMLPDPLAPNPIAVLLLVHV
jgi:uncharacterized membrane protein YeaQ/YmgE (transglycosylase-associated protein family)